MVVVLEELQPTRVGRVFRPRLMKVLASGMAGKEVPLAMLPVPAIPDLTATFYN